MANSTTRTSLIKAAGRVVRELVGRPFRFENESEDEQSGTIFAEPLPTEMAIDSGAPALFPANGYLQDGIQFLRGRTIWAVDGGIQQWKFPNGVLLVGRAVVSRTS